MNLSQTTQQIEENWNKIRTEIRKQWPQMTQGDVKMIDGDPRKLIALVYQKTGLRLDEIEEQIDKIAANSSGLLNRVTQFATDAATTVAETVNESASTTYRDIKNTVVADAAKTTAVTLGAGFLIGFCAVGCWVGEQGIHDAFGKET